VPKNYQNLITGFQVTVGDVFETQCIQLKTPKCNYYSSIFDNKLKYDTTAVKHKFLIAIFHNVVSIQTPKQKYLEIDVTSFSGSSEISKSQKIVFYNNITANM